MHQRGVQHFSQMKARLYVGEMLTLGPSTSAEIPAHEVQNAYLSP